MGIDAEVESKCKRKVKYGHEETAQKAIDSMKKKGRYGLSAYKCLYCDGWHIGHAGKTFTILFKFGGTH